MKKILFPFEVGNPIYREAYVYAVKFARNLHTELILLNVFKLEVGNDVTRERYTLMLRDKWIRAYNELSKYNQYYLENHSRAEDELQIKFDHRFIHGIFKEQVNAAAAEEEIGTIILPLSESRDFSKRQLEIIQENVLVKNRVSLLIIPANMAFRQIRNILFLTDLTPVYQFQQYLDEIVRIAGAMESRIHFVHFNAKAPDQGIQETESYSKILQTTGKYPQHVFRELKGSNLIRTMMQYGEEISADLMVVIKQEHSLLEALLHKSISNELSLSSSVPVLVMRENKES